MGLLERYSDGGLMFNDRWDRFCQSWRVATPRERVVLNDGRPAIRREPSPDEEDGEITYTTIAPALWEKIKQRQREAFALTPPPPRTRLCQACRAPLKVAREYGDCWTFVCDQCKSTEIHGKDLVGGTWGAGEAEKR